jgi:hypothetical protein
MFELIEISQGIKNFALFKTLLENYFKLSFIP